MASNPVNELEIFAFDKDASPGFLYDSSTKKIFPGDEMHNINKEMCIPKYEIDFKSKEDIISLKKSECFNMYPWSQDIDNTKLSDCILVHGVKICECKGDVEPHLTLHVVSSICYKLWIDLLICFNDQVKKKDIEDLRNYIEIVKGMEIEVVKGMEIEIVKGMEIEVVKGMEIEIVKGMENKGSRKIQDKDEGSDSSRSQSDVALIPANIHSAFVNGWIYASGKRIPVTSAKYGLEEFCRYLVHTEISKFPATYKVKGPLYTSQVSCAPVVKKETINAHDEIDYNRSPVAQSYCIGEVSSSVMHTEKQSQGIESPDKHKNWINADLEDNNKTPSSQHSVGAVKASEQNKNISDKNLTHLPRIKETLSEKPVNMSRKQPLHSYQISERKCFSKDCEISPHDAQYSGNAACHQSNQNQTRKSECVELNMIASKNCDQRAALKSQNSASQKRPLEKEIEEKSDSPQSLHIAAGEHESSFDENYSKSEYKEVKSQRMSGKIISDTANFLECNNSNAESCLTLIHPDTETEVCGMKRKYYGVIPKTEGKTIILLGASGSGKTSLVNFIANYFKGNKSAADKLIQVVRNSNDAQGHTTQITGYTFCANDDDNPLTIIDTPGLNDSSGGEVQDHVQSLKTFLANAESQNLDIHAIGFVAQAHIVRLTSSERLVMNYISSLFGEGIGNHVISLITFSDSQETPPVVEAITRYGVPCSEFLKFNNSALSSNTEEEIDELDRIYWRIGCKSWKKCIKLLGKLPSLSFKSLKDEIYVTQIMETAERDLRNEINSFMYHHTMNKTISKEALNNAERVWTLAETVNKLRSINKSQCTAADDILLNYVEEICTMKTSRMTTKECMQQLSLSPSRPLLKAGLAILSSFAPLYNSPKPRNFMQTKDITDVLFCLWCEEDHVLEKSTSKSGNWFSFLDKSGYWFPHTKIIGYKCTKCPCDGNVHGEKSSAEKDDIAVSNGFTPNKLRHHIRNCIEKVLNDLCLPEYRIHESEYIRWLKCLAKKEAQQLCTDLLSTG